MNTDSPQNANTRNNDERESARALRGMDAEALYCRYAPMVTRRCRQLLGNDEEAADAAQEIFVKVIAEGGLGRAEFPTKYLWTMTTNHCLNLLKDRARWDRNNNGEALLERIVNFDPDGDIERRMDVRGILGKLFRRHPQSTHVIAVLHLFDGMTLEKTAEVVGMSKSGVRKRLRVLRESLKDMTLENADITDYIKSTPCQTRLILPLVACAALLIILPLGDILKSTVKPNQQSGVIDADRDKGVILSDAVIEVWRKDGDDIEMLVSGDSAQGGDIVQLRYIVPTQRYGVIISVDGRGAVYVHLSDDNRAAELLPNVPVTLKDAYKLDDAPRYEVFYLITAQEQFNVDDVKQALAGAEHPVEKLSLSIVTDITTFTLVKSE